MHFNLKSTDLMGLPRISSLDDLSFHTKISKGLLYKMARVSEKFYMEFSIPKKNGGNRVLACPSKKMKSIQAWILVNILKKAIIHPSATAYIKGKNIKSNILPHKENSYILCIDLKNFFDNIPFFVVFDIFKSLGYPKRVSYLLANICCYKGALPQGGITSPTLSNIACINLDRRISKLSGFRNIVYSRYADDMSFSANNPEKLIKSLQIINEIIEDEGFSLNSNKTRLLGPGNQRQITGLIINHNKRVTIGRKKTRIIRSAIYKLETTKMSDESKLKLSNWINGWLNYLSSVDTESRTKLLLYHEKLKSIKEAAPSLDFD